MHSRQTLISHSVINLLRQRKKTLGVAESCTGGLIAEWLTRVSGASDVFAGGVVSYSDDAKSRLLGIDPELIKVHGSVSEIVAKEMASCLKKALSVDFALSTTGFAGPTGGTPDAPIGTVYIALATPLGTVEAVKHYFPDKPRQSIRELATLEALYMLERHLHSI
jgi:nicotinamide-nucleotide amidase